ncbi:MAG: hypothetical protein LBH69_04595 [Methanomassiliicoccaceae archaeon]|jgi:hypothetical protein|nr:hypothetical protein [Methanomassiliicoccaceae archaeon]
MFGITVRSEKEDKRIPIAVASDVMFDVQLLLTHIGESFIAEEFGSHDRPAEALAERFTLYIDPESGGISFKASAGKGQSALMDKAAAKLMMTLEKMGSGSGTYWMEDSYNDPRYRCMVLYDLMQLSKHMASDRGYTLLFGTDGKENKFEPLDLGKAQAFLDRNGKIAKGSVAGILNGARTKRNAPMYGFVVGEDRVKISFRSKDAEGDASRYVNGPVVLKGTLKYSDDGELLEVSDIESAEPFNVKMFRHMISAERDIPLAASVGALVGYDSGTMLWKVSYPDLGISSSDQDWDTAVAGFHDYFVFLCDNYSDTGKELSDEEKEVKELLDSLTGGAE